MKGFLRRLAIGVTGNERGQRFLARMAERILALMGIGTGGLVESSGEGALIRRLLEAPRSPADTLCVFDVGANEGTFVGLVRDGLGKAPHEIHAFEPGPETFRLLQERVGGAPHVTLNRAALGSTEGSLPFYSDRPGSPLASLYPRDLSRFGIVMNRVDSVPVTTLDRYCESRGITRIDLLKLDVEGHELEVLRGASRMLGEKRISMVTFEFGGCHVDSRAFFRDFHDLLTAAGLGRIYRITPSGHLSPVGPYRVFLEQFQTTNYLACSGAS